MKYYDRPNPHSIGDTAIMYRIQRQDKDEFKIKELREELRQEDKKSDRISQS